MRLSSAAKRQTTVGEIVNLISVDAQKLQDSPPYDPNHISFTSNMANVCLVQIDN